MSQLSEVFVRQPLVLDTEEAFMSYDEKIGKILN